VDGSVDGRLVVLGKHVPGLAFVGLLMDDTPSLAPEYGFYQRLVARDQSEATELIDTYIKTEPPASGASHVAALLIESRNYLGGLLEMPRVSVQDTADAAGVSSVFVGGGT
jgi:hypothetical protein